MYDKSIHNVAIVEKGLNKSANCADCHGAHDMRDRTDPASSINRKNLPATCGKCHGSDAIVAKGKRAITVNIVPEEILTEAKSLAGDKIVTALLTVGKLAREAAVKAEGEPVAEHTFPERPETSLVPDGADVTLPQGAEDPRPDPFLDAAHKAGVAMPEEIAGMDVSVPRYECAVSLHELALPRVPRRHAGQRHVQRRPDRRRRRDRGRRCG